MTSFNNLSDIPDFSIYSTVSNKSKYLKTEVRYVTAVKTADIYNFKSSFKYCKRVSFKPIFLILYTVPFIYSTRYRKRLICIQIVNILSLCFSYRQYCQVTEYLLVDPLVHMVHVSLIDLNIMETMLTK